MARRDTAPSFERVQSSWYHLYFALHTIRDIDGLSPIPERRNYRLRRFVACFTFSQEMTPHGSRFVSYFIAFPT
jgi:hypothetical protein